MDIQEQSFIIIDFETVTPKGYSPEPIQMGLVGIDNLTVSEHKRKSWFIKPPDYAPLTYFDTLQTKITKKDLEDADSADSIFNILENICSEKDYIFIAQNANYEYNICKRYSESRENLKNVKFIDTIKLAKLQFPNLKSYKLDELARLLEIKIPEGRHSALVDCVITGEVFVKLIKSLGIKTIDELLNKSCINNQSYSQLNMFS